MAAKSIHLNAGRRSVVTVVTVIGMRPYSDTSPMGRYMCLC
jgi:hypothetical protein